MQTRERAPCRLHTAPGRKTDMRQIVIIALAYGITPLLMALTILLAWWLAKQDGAYGEGEG